MPSLEDEYLAMNGANRFLLAHCQKTLDRWYKELRGISHSVNRCNADYADCWAAVEGLRTRAALQCGEMREANAAIGALQQQVAGLEESLQKSRDAYSALQKAVNGLQKAVNGR